MVLNRIFKDKLVEVSKNCIKHRIKEEFDGKMD